MPRGELPDHVLLCGYEDSHHNVHGIGMRKRSGGSMQIGISYVEKSTFSPETGLTISGYDIPKRVIEVDPELVYVHEHMCSLDRWGDGDSTQDAIAQLLIFALNHTLDKYHGYCVAPIDRCHGGDHMAFVFISKSGKVTALPITSTMSKMPAVVYVNHLQPGLRYRDFWHAYRFEPLDTIPKKRLMEGETDVTSLRSVIIANVLTFNAMNFEREEEYVTPNISAITKTTYPWDCSCSRY